MVTFMTLESAAAVLGSGAAGYLGGSWRTSVVMWQRARLVAAIHAVSARPGWHPVPTDRLHTAARWDASADRSVCVEVGPAGRARLTIRRSRWTQPAERRVSLTRALATLADPAAALKEGRGMTTPHPASMACGLGFHAWCTRSDCLCPCHHRDVATGQEGDRP